MHDLKGEKIIYTSIVTLILYLGLKFSSRSIEKKHALPPGEIKIHVKGMTIMRNNHSFYAVDI